MTRTAVPHPFKKVWTSFDQLLKWSFGSRWIMRVRKGMRRIAVVRLVDAFLSDARREDEALRPGTPTFLSVS